MNTITLLQPPRIVFGDGCAAQSAEWLVQRGVKRIGLVTSTHVRTDFLCEALKRLGAEVCESPPVDCEPTVGMYREALGLARAARVEAVLGIGGGSAMDMAKLLAALIEGDQEVEAVFGINQLRARSLPLVCLPTTAGTGAEVSPNAILLDERDAMKKGVVSPHLVPDAAFVDPSLTLSVPAPVTAATGFDALTHCIEAYANKHAHPMIDLYALEGIRLIAAHLPTAVRDGSDAAARAGLALGSLYGGLCLGPVNTAAVHALAYPLGGAFRIAHGVSNALLLPRVLKFNLPASPVRYAEVAAALGVERNGSAEGTAVRGLEALERLSVSCGVPQRLSALGVPREALPSLAQAAMQVTRLLKNNPRVLNEQDAVRIYEECY